MVDGAADFGAADFGAMGEQVLLEILIRLSIEIFYNLSMALIVTKTLCKYEESSWNSYILEFRILEI